MKFIVILFIAICSFLHLEGQIYSLKPKSTLDKKVAETSGLICVSGKFYTHGDSGDDAVLYEIDTLNGNVIRVLPIMGAHNIDWEEITSDDSFVYIGDFGNNSGMRKDLRIYKFRTDFLKLDTVFGVDTILFQYQNQTGFSNKTYQTNFDAEAMFATDSCLFIFSKNWGNFKTYIYRCPKIKGQYQLNIIDSINSMGLITGACKSNVSSKIMLCGYTFNAPFVIECDSFLFPGYKNTIKRQEYSAMGNIQIEAIAEVSKNRYFLTSEKLSADQTLFDLNKLQVAGLQKLMGDGVDFKIAQIQNSKHIIWNSKYPIHHIQVVDFNGMIVRKNDTKDHVSGEIDLNNLATGVYLLRGITDFGAIVSMKFYLLE